jgi:asparagine synthase (glutamine-hydrolysing)
VFRYLTFAWSEENPVARETARELIARHAARGAGWSDVLIAEGLQVTCAGIRPGSSEPYLLDGGDAVVLGKLFERADGSSSKAVPVLLPGAASRAILQTRGRVLIERYWGRYVAFLPEPATRTLRVLRDPSALLPCLMLQYAGVSLFFSSMREVEHLGLPRFEVSWDYLAATVCRGRQLTHGTGLKGVLQVLGGECVAVGRDQLTRSFHWNPVQIATSSPIEDPHEATRLLGERVRDAVHAWAQSYEGILLSLSGGLDSSIVFACLRDAPLKGPLTCYHYYPAGPDTDERDYARRVARSGHHPLIERVRDPALSFVPLRQIPRTHQPCNYAYYLEHSRLDAQLAAEHHASAVFTGWGGDQLFFQDHAIWAAADHVGRHGLGPKAWRIALDCARLDRISVWAVLRAALRRRKGRESGHVWDEMSGYRTLIQPEVLKHAGQSLAYLHPLVRDTRGIPRGKLWHLLQLLGGSWEYYDPLGLEEDPETLAPLYSQPVIEACLLIPTDVLTLGGWFRAIARRAFREALPPEITDRVYKGAIEDHLYCVLRHNITFVRELLLDGALVKSGIIDRRKLTQALSGGANRLETGRAELLEYVGIEAWLRAWEQATPRSDSSERAHREGTYSTRR